MRPKELSRKPTGAGGAHNQYGRLRNTGRSPLWQDWALAVYHVSSTPFKKKEQLCLKRIYWQAKEFW
jgi:hypothetical protein